MLQITLTLLQKYDKIVHVIKQQMRKIGVVQWN